jgi:hypothetical protein
MVATAQRGRVNQKVITATADPTPPERMTRGEDGHPVRLWEVDGELVPFSLREWPHEERPVFWNPLGPGEGGQQMWVRAQVRNEIGIFPVIWKQRWIDGKFAPANEWELHVTKEWMKATMEGCGDPDAWKGYNHPDGPDHYWRCECGWPCGTWNAFAQHRRSTGHRESMSE